MQKIIQESVHVKSAMLAECSEHILCESVEAALK